MSFPQAESELPPTLYWAARVEDRLQARLNAVLRRRGWTPTVLPYSGYGTDGWARVLARVVLTPPGIDQEDAAGPRGWRRFFAATAADVEVAVTLGTREHRVRTERGGYLDTVLACDLPPGRGTGTLTAAGALPQDTPVTVAVHVVGPDTVLGLVSDIDDTVVVTALPRPLVAFWNTFVRRETSRRPVRGMATLYQQVLAEHPDAFVVYLSTGAWNVAPALAAFLRRFGFPDGPLLLTDWGPTAQGMFRSGPEHKRDQLRRLLAELPQLRWLFVGDDGQLDPVLYGEAAAADPGTVRAIAIRQLTPAEQVLTHGSPGPPAANMAADRAAEYRSSDGFGLLAQLRAAGVLRAGDAAADGPPRRRLRPLRRPAASSLPS